MNNENGFETNEEKETGFESSENRYESIENQELQSEKEHMEPIDRQPVRQSKKSGGFRKGAKGVAASVGAGMVGSALTLALVANTHLFGLNGAQAEPASAVQTASSKADSSYNVEMTGNSQLSVADMVEKTSNAIVGIVNMQDQNNPFGQSRQNVEAGSGSGVIFQKDSKYAYIVTNNHVIEGAKSLEVTLASGEKTEAEVMGSDALSDLAVLKIDAKYAEAVLSFGDSDTLRAGDQVVAIGNPLGLDFSRTVTKGIVSATNRTINVNTSAGNWDFNVIQTDAAINPGNSGGALLNGAGELIGINSLKISENGVEGLGFAIPSNDAKPIIEQLMKTGKIERPYMGVSLADLEQIPFQYVKGLPAEVDGGVMVTALDEGSAADQAGLEVQDVITKIDKTDIKNAADLRKYIYTNTKAGDRVKMTVYRNGEMKEITMTLTKKA